MLLKENILTLKNEGEESLVSFLEAQKDVATINFVLDCKNKNKLI